jgi:hypothetical protein
LSLVVGSWVIHPHHLKIKESGLLSFRKQGLLAQSRCPVKICWRKLGFIGKKTGSEGQDSSKCRNS